MCQFQSREMSFAIFIHYQRPLNIVLPISVQNKVLQVVIIITSTIDLCDGYEMAFGEADD